VPSIPVCTGLRPPENEAYFFDRRFFHRRTSKVKHSIHKAVVYSFFLGLIFSACSDNGPGKSELRQSLAVQLPSFLSVESFEIQASQNAGTQVEPVYETRFSAAIKINEDTYVEAGKENNILFVMPQKKSQDTLKVFGKTTSRLYAGTWKTDVHLDGEPHMYIGKPLGAFSAQRILIKGSPEEKQYRAEVQKAAEEARLAQEKAAEEARLSQEKKEQQRIESIRKAPQIVVGRWRGKNYISIINKDGTGQMKEDNGTIKNFKWSVEDDIFKQRWIDNGNIVNYIIVDISANHVKYKCLRNNLIEDVKRLD
jgi:hypothetical protein